MKLKHLLCGLLTIMTCIGNVPMQRVYAQNDVLQTEFEEPDPDAMSIPEPVSSEDKTEAESKEEPKTEKKETEERQKTASEPGVKKSVKDIDVILESSNANIQLSLAGTNVEPKAGHIFIETTFTIKNNSDKELNMNRMSANFYGTADGKGEIYPIIVGDLAGAKRLEGVIKKGESATGYVAWEVPENFKSVNIEFVPDMMEADSIAFTVRR